MGHRSRCGHWCGHPPDGGHILSLRFGSTWSERWILQGMRPCQGGANLVQQNAAQPGGAVKSRLRQKTVCEFYTSPPIQPAYNSSTVQYWSVLDAREAICHESPDVNRRVPFPGRSGTRGRAVDWGSNGFQRREMPGQRRRFSPAIPRKGRTSRALWPRVKRASLFSWITCRESHFSRIFTGVMFTSAPAL
jgi:hypothetical protein